jgi:hypothetical protein
MRILLESDHDHHDSSAAIPSRLERAEFLIAQQFGLDVNNLWQIAW